MYFFRNNSGLQNNCTRFQNFCFSENKTKVESVKLEKTFNFGIRFKYDFLGGKGDNFNILYLRLNTLRCEIKF